MRVHALPRSADYSSSDRHTNLAGFSEYEKSALARHLVLHSTKPILSAPKEALQQTPADLLTTALPEKWAPFQQNDIHLSAGPVMELRNSSRRGLNRNTTRLRATGWGFLWSTTFAEPTLHARDSRFPYPLSMAPLALVR